MLCYIQSIFRQQTRQHVYAQNDKDMNLQLTLVVDDLDDDLAPGLSSSQRLQSLGNALQANKALILEGRSLELATGNKVEDPLPDLAHSRGLKLGVLTPMHTDDADVL